MSCTPTERTPENIIKRQTIEVTVTSEASAAAPRIVPLQSALARRVLLRFIDDVASRIARQAEKAARSLS